MTGVMPLLPGLGNATFINNLIEGVGDLIALVPQLTQNGPAHYGLLPSPVLPPFLGGPGAGAGQSPPWGNATANGTNYYDNVPNTGVTRSYNLTIRRGTIAPDGLERSVILINDQFPGPLLEADWGDMFSITVNNQIESPEEGTTLHWHGLTQKKTPWYDGVPSVSQCPIAPGNSFTFNFQADLYGSSWYHSHYSAQYAGGLFGPMVIYGPRNVEYDIDLGPIMLSDYYHKDYYSIVESVVGPNPVAAELTTSDNTLIQGKMDFDCNVAPAGSNCTGNAGLSKFEFTPGKTHRLRLINTSAAAFMVVSLDDHDMTVIANDYVEVEPYTVKSLSLFVGQRVDVLVTANANNPSGAYWLRARQPVLCALAAQPFALAAVYYKGVAKDTSARPKTAAHVEFGTPTLIDCVNDPLSKTVPFYAIEPPAANPDKEVTVKITQNVNSTGHVHYEMNYQTFMANYNEPLLGLVHDGNDTYPLDPQWNVYNFGDAEWVRIVFQNEVPFAHPMHVHGQNMYVLDEGTGSWDGKTIINPQNPQRRDTQTLRPNGYLVVLLKSDNPGPWPFHCHIAWHVSQGLYINVLQKPDSVNQTQIPGVLGQTCDAWNKYSSSHTVDEIDSGV